MLSTSRTRRHRLRHTSGAAGRLRLLRPHPGRHPARPRLRPPAGLLARYDHRNVLRTHCRPQHHPPLHDGAWTRPAGARWLNAPCGRRHDEGVSDCLLLLRAWLVILSLFRCAVRMADLCPLGCLHDGDPVHLRIPLATHPLRQACLHTLPPAPRADHHRQIQL
eukprot:scaffold213055_cov36-Tisochrysis_lutea.AAC.1